MWIRWVDYFLAAAGLLGHITLLMVLVRRRLLSRLPVFAAVIVFYLVRSALLLTPHFAIVWPGCYWLLIYLDPVLQLLLIIVLVAWCSSAGSGFGRAAVVLAIPFCALVAALAALHLGTASYYSPHNLSIKLGMFVSVLWLQLGAAFFFWVRASDLRTRLSSYIVLGFAVYSAANLAAELTRMHFAPLRQPALYTGLSYFSSGIYLCCLAGWSVLFSRESSQGSPSLHSFHSRREIVQ
jgi:hypothetical protein